MAVTTPFSTVPLHACHVFVLYPAYADLCITFVWQLFYRPYHIILCTMCVPFWFIVYIIYRVAYADLIYILISVNIYI